MDYLSLLQRLHLESGRSGITPSAVTGLTGMNSRLLGWIDDAYRNVQLLHDSWLFRRGDFSYTTVASTQNYTASDASLSDLADWKYNPDGNYLSGIRIYSSVSDEQDMFFIPWDDFKTSYKYGSHRTQTGRPTVFSIKYDGSMDLWAIPNAVFTVNGEYIKQADTMSANNDTPVIPSDYHMIIVWGALMLYGAYEGAPEDYARGQDEYDKILLKLEYNQLPKIRFGPSLV